jgi:hypothetical protein
MRHLFLFSLLMSWVIVASAETTGRGGLYFGSKSLNHSDWGNLDSQGAWGINLDVKDTTWPLWITGSYLYSSDEETVITSASPLTTHDIEGKTSEIHLGVKKDFYPVKIARVSIAGGPAYINASLDNATPPHNNDSDGTIGYWAGAETLIHIGYIGLGLSYNYSQANVTLFNQSVEAGGSNLAFSFGFGW